MLQMWWSLLREVVPFVMKSTHFLMDWSNFNIMTYDWHKIALGKIISEQGCDLNIR
jgi:hypothetical protein